MLNTSGCVADAVPEARRLFVASSVLLAITYFDALCILDVTFRSGTTYRYFCVDGPTFAQFCSAPSKGRFFNARVKDRFPCLRISH